MKPNVEMSNSTTNAPVGLTVLIILSIHAVILSYCQCCQFPEYLQTRGADSLRREWHIYSTVSFSAEDIAMSSRLGGRTGYSGTESWMKQRTSAIVSFRGFVMRLDTSSAYSASTERTGLTGDSDTEELVNNLRAPFTRECVEEIGGKYLTTHRYRSDADNRYICLEFISRSNLVVHIRQSRLSDVMLRSLCEEAELVLNDWPMIDRANTPSRSQNCPLKGGFNIHVHDKRDKTGTCDVYDGETRLESTCMPGDGMIFRFRHHQCIPRGLQMQVTQPVWCLASWSDGSDTYVILRHDTDYQAVWCLRYTDYDGAHDRYTAVLHRHVHCERPVSAEQGPADTNHIRLDLIRDTRFTATPRNQLLCDDDYEACNYWADPCSLPNTRVTCARKCSICSPDFRAGEGCSIPPQFRGNWTETLTDYEDNIEVDETSLIIYKNRAFKCITWKTDPSSHQQLQQQQTGISTGDGRGLVWEQMFVTSFFDGCRPRYVCAQFEMTSSSVLWFRLSQSEIWPFEGTTDVNSITCALFRYKNDNEPFGNRYRSKQFKILLNANPAGRTGAACRLPRTFEFEARFDKHSGTFSSSTAVKACRGSISADGPFRIMLRYYTDCFGQKLFEKFTCLQTTYDESLRNNNSSVDGVTLSSKYWIIISQTSESVIQCWIFVHSRFPVTVYLISSANCHEDAYERIQSGSFLPLVTFKELYTPTTNMPFTNVQESNQVHYATQAMTLIDTSYITVRKYGYAANDQELNALDDFVDEKEEELFYEDSIEVVFSTSPRRDNPRDVRKTTLKSRSVTGKGLHKAVKDYGAPSRSLNNNIICLLLLLLRMFTI